MIPIALGSIPMESAEEVCHFFGALVNKKCHDMHIRVNFQYRGGDVFEECCLASLWWRNDQPALPASDWAEEIDQSADRWAAWVFKGEPWRRIDAGEVFELLAGSKVFGGHAFDFDEPFDDRARLAWARWAAAFPASARFFLYDFDFDLEPIAQRQLLSKVERYKRVVWSLKRLRGGIGQLSDTPL